MENRWTDPKRIEGQFPNSARKFHHEEKNKEKIYPIEEKRLINNKVTEAKFSQNRRKLEK